MPSASSGGPPGREWLARIPPRPDEDRPLASSIHEIAAEWAESLRDEHARFAAIMRVSNVWRKTDPAAAMRWRSESLRR